MISQLIDRCAFVELDDGRIAMQHGIPNNVYSRHYFETYHDGQKQLLLPNMCKVIRKATQEQYKVFVAGLRNAIIIDWLCSPTGRVRQ